VQRSLAHDRNQESQDKLYYVDALATATAELERTKESLEAAGRKTTAAHAALAQLRESADMRARSLASLIHALGAALLGMEETLGPFAVGVVMRALPASSLTEVLNALPVPDAARLQKWLELHVRQLADGGGGGGMMHRRGGTRAEVVDLKVGTSFDASR
jgi:hypothetical protein